MAHFVRFLSIKPTRLATAAKATAHRHVSFVANVKLLEELKVNDEKCTKSFESGRFLAYHKGRPLLKFNKEDGTRLDIMELTYNDVLRHFTTMHSLFGNAVLLGLGSDSIARCAVSIPSKPESLANEIQDETGGMFMDMRAAIFLLPYRYSPIVSQGGGLLYWHHHFKFCNRCGKETIKNVAGSHIKCSSCSQLYYPQLSPVAISVVSNSTYDKCLLVRQPRLPPGMYTAIAGYVEVGEMLEDAVKREIAEEVGIEISSQEYLFSQHWPLPMSSLMMGCLAIADPRSKLTLDIQELEDARWFSKQEVAQAVERIEKNPHLRFSSSVEDHILIPPKGAVAHDLIKHWLTKSS